MSPPPSRDSAVCPTPAWSSSLSGAQFLIHASFCEQTVFLSPAPLTSRLWCLLSLTGAVLAFLSTVLELPVQPEGTQGPLAISLVSRIFQVWPDDSDSNNYF